MYVRLFRFQFAHTTSLCFPVAQHDYFLQEKTLFFSFAVLVPTIHNKIVIYTSLFCAVDCRGEAPAARLSLTIVYRCRPLMATSPKFTRPGAILEASVKACGITYFRVKQTSKPQSKAARSGVQYHRLHRWPTFYIFLIFFYFIYFNSMRSADCSFCWVPRYRECRLL